MKKEKRIYLKPKPMKVGQNKQTYEVYYVGKLILSSHDPEHAAARYFKNKADILKVHDFKTLKLRSTVNVAGAAKHRISETQQEGLRRKGWGV